MIARCNHTSVVSVSDSVFKALAALCYVVATLLMLLAYLPS